MFYSILIVFFYSKLYVFKKSSNKRNFNENLVAWPTHAKNSKDSRTIFFIAKFFRDKRVLVRRSANAAAAAWLLSLSSSSYSSTFSWRCESQVCKIIQALS